MNLSTQISVISIFYNSAAYCRKNIESIAAQRGVCLEIILVDDCSSDETRSILKEYASKDSRIKLVFHDANKGISGARNSGMNAATGDCFYFIDGDDYLVDGGLEALARHFSDEVDWVQGGYNICNEQGDVLKIASHPDGVYASHQDIVGNFDKNEFIYIHNRLINKKYKTHHLAEGKYHEDRLWNVELFSGLSYIVNVACPTYNYIIHSSNFSSSSRSHSLYIDSGLELLRKMDEAATCWNLLADTFLITAIEKPLYLWSHSKKYRKNVVSVLKRRRPLSINLKGFPRFTQLIHQLIARGCPDCLIVVICSCYRAYMNARKKPF